MTAAEAAWLWCTGIELQFVLRSPSLELLAEFPKPEGMYVLRLYRFRNRADREDPSGGSGPAGEET